MRETTVYSQSIIWSAQALKKVLFLCFVIIAFIICLHLPSFQAASTVSSSDNYRYKSVTVQEGDSLWTLAERYSTTDSDSIPQYVKRIKEINHIKGNTIYAGDQLIVVYDNTVAGR